MLLDTRCWQDRDSVLTAFQEHTFKLSCLKPATAQLHHLDHCLLFVYRNVVCNSTKRGVKTDFLWLGPLVYPQEKSERTAIGCSWQIHTGWQSATCCLLCPPAACFLAVSKNFSRKKSWWSTDKYSFVYSSVMHSWESALEFPSCYLGLQRKLCNC